MKVAILIPAFNEEKNIVSTLTAVASLVNINEILVINDASQDRTSALVQDFALKDRRVTLLNLSENKGKGGALNAGLTKIKADVYLLLDADLGDTAVQAQALLLPVLEGKADLTIAEFSQSQTTNPTSMGFGLVRRSAVLGVYLLTGRKITSPLSGQRALTDQLIREVGPFFEGFGIEIGLTVGALQHGFRVLEIPVTMKHEGYGRGIAGFKHRGRQFFHVVKALWLCRKKGWY